MTLFLVLTLLAAVASAQQSPEKVFSRPGFNSAGGCSTLLLDPASANLYVGCRGFIARLWAFNINDTAENVAVTRSFKISDREESECRNSATASECAPAVRDMFLRPTAESLIVCSSVAMKPELRVLDANKLIDKEDPRTVIGICSTDARFNGTAVHVEWGNPGEAAAFYSGIRTGMAGENHLIYRPALNEAGKEAVPALRTVYTDNTWLNDPQFVASFDIGEYVYFFFREVAVEIGFAPPTVYSRVARVCKKDVGGRTVLRQVWTSFVKARLNCSINARFPYYFDHIQSISRVEIEGDTLFYASMSTSEAAFPASAICVYALTEVDKLFGHGVFLEQQSTGVWLPTPADSAPSTHRPGSCTANSSTLSDSDLHFARTHLLMAEPVSGGDPIMPTRDAFFHSILVDVQPEQNVVFVVDHRTGLMWKLAHWFEGGASRWSLLQHHKLQVEGRITDMALLPHEFLYASSSSATVSQFSIAACQLHATCHACAVDPFCSWSSAEGVCARREKAKGTGWIASWAGRGWSECASAAPVATTVYLGDALHLEGEGRGGVEDEDKEWRKDGRPLVREGVVETADGGIVVMNVRAEDGGEYVRGSRRYRVTVDTECDRPTTVAGYHAAHREYCKELKRAKVATEEWQTCQQASLLV